MLKSMTGFSKYEANEKGIKTIIELKSLNGRYLEFNCRLPRSISFREVELREIVKKSISRGTVSLNVSVEYSQAAKPFSLNEEAFRECYDHLMAIKKKFKIKDDVRIDHILHFSNEISRNENSNGFSEEEFKLMAKALKEALKNLDKMRTNEGKQIYNDIQNRIKLISTYVQKIETQGIERIPQERDRLRQKIAMLFESDEIDESRLQLEIVIQSNKLDISEECVRLRSHIKFFNEALKSNQPVGQKLNFLLQEMHREVNTIGSKADDASISQLVIGIKEELERIREQVQNVE